MDRALRVLDQTYQFDSRLSDCDGCPLEEQKEVGECLAFRPIEFNGVMLVGEFPQNTEIRLSSPLLGRRQEVLRQVLGWAQLDYDECYITNSVLCGPSTTDPDKFKTALSATRFCRSRLLTEIAHVRPRVLVLLGQAPLDAITGHGVKYHKRVPSDCSVCANERGWFVWTCSRKCDVETPWTEDTKPEGRHECGGEQTGAWVKRKRVCGECGGKLTRVVEEERFESDHALVNVAGSVSRLSEYEAGKWVEGSEDIIVIPTFHPSYLLRPIKTATDKKIGGQFLVGAACHHFAKVRRLLHHEPDWGFEWRTLTEPAEFLAYLEAEPEGGGLYAVDIETDNKLPTDVTDVRCIGIGSAARGDVVVVNTAGLLPTHPLVEVVRAFLEDAAYQKIYQNGQYDISVLRLMWGITHQGYVGDTLVQHHSVAPDEPHNLAHMAFTYTDAPPWKPPKRRGGMEVFTTDEELHLYNARDVRITALVYRALSTQMVKESAVEVAALDMRKYHLALHMGEYGMPVDMAVMRDIESEAQGRQDAAFDRLRDLAGKIPASVDKRTESQPFNPNSVRHLQWVLFDPTGRYKLVPKDFTGTGLPSTSKSSLMVHRDNEFADALLNYRDAQKTLATYVTKLPVKEDGRIRCQWKPCGTRTGRWSSSPNLQNWPKWLRGAVRAPEGRLLVGADYAQLELRILAALSGDSEMIRRCRDADEGRKLDPEWDPHSYVASLSFPQYVKLDVNDSAHDSADDRCKCQKCKRKQLRDLSKRVVYGLNYGAGAATIVDSIMSAGYSGRFLDEATINRVISAYFKAFPDVRTYRDMVIGEATRSGYVREPLIGRRRVFPRKEVDATVASNFAIQSAAASIMDVSAWNLYCKLSEVDPSAGIIAQVHDAIYVECEESLAEDMALLVEESLCCAVQLVDGAEWMPLVASAEIGRSWKDV